MQNPEDIQQKAEKKQDIKLLAITWNMARTAQNDVDFSTFLHQPQDHDIIVICFEESKDRAGFMELLTNYMSENNFKKMSSTYMYEIFIVAFIIKSKMSLISGKITTNFVACGALKGLPVKFGNKGGLQINFTLNGMTYNIIGVHLIHKQDNRIKRDEMMGDIIKSFKYER